MKIKILWLYESLMNLYGNSGNIRCLERHLKDNGVQVQITKLEIGDKPDFTDVDFIYMGGGTERSRDRALLDMRRYADELSQYIKNGGLCLFCGNSFELLGRKIIDINQNATEALSICAFESFEQKTRIVVDTVCKSRLFDEKIIGFMNKQTVTSIVPNPLFRTVSGVGNSPDRNDEGILDGGLFASQLAGPLLVRNPHFRAYIENALYNKKNLDLKAKTYEYEQKAYEESLKGLTK